MNLGDEGIYTCHDEPVPFHFETDTPITVHTHVANESGLAAAEVFVSEGCDMSKVVLGHSGDTGDLYFTPAR